MHSKFPLQTPSDMRSPSKNAFRFPIFAPCGRERYIFTLLSTIEQCWSAFLGASSASLYYIAAFQITHLECCGILSSLSLFSITRVSLSNNASLVHRLAATRETHALRRYYAARKRRKDAAAASPVSDAEIQQRQQ
jgi:sensor c-di-GMP phosphodiesterase-like protein